MIEDFKEARRVSTPIILINTPDYRQAIKDLVGADQLKAPAVCWNMCAGHVAYNEAGKKAVQCLGPSIDTVQAPSLVLQRSVGWTNDQGVYADLPKQSILLMTFPDDDVLGDPVVAQAIANVRDVFKTNQRILVILGRNLRLPALVAEDVPIINVPLPSEDTIKGIVKSVYGYAKVPPSDGDINKAATYLRGMTAFAVEDVVARKIRREGLDVSGLAKSQQVVIEASTNRALTFERQKVTFDDVGGQAAIKDFMTKLFAGPKAPKVVVRIDEIEKSIGANVSGPVQDNTGVSQGILRSLLTSMEDNQWLGLVALGGPGAGKTLCTSAVANTYGCLSLVGDLGAVKSSLVGSSEANMRRMMDVLLALAGDRLLVMATSNKLGVMPPELLRRFNLGIWYFARLTEQEKKSIWTVQAKKHGVSLEQEMPDDGDWVGSDIKNCVQRAWMLNCSLKEAAKFITISGKVSAKDVAQLDLLAENSGFLCANNYGVFKREGHQKKEGREISL